MKEWKRINPDGSETVGILEDVAVVQVEKPVEKPETAEKPKKKTTKKK